MQAADRCSETSLPSLPIPFHKPYHIPCQKHVPEKVSVHQKSLWNNKNSLWKPETDRADREQEKPSVNPRQRVQPAGRQNKKGGSGALRSTGTPGNGKAPPGHPGRTPAGTTAARKYKGIPGSQAPPGIPISQVECGGVLLSHTLSSAVPSPRPGLSFRVRKGTGRLTWAMTTAKPIQRPTHQGIGRQNRNHATIPIVAVREPDNGREQKRFTGIVIVTTRKQCSLPSNERNHHRTRPDPASGSESVPRSPVSTGRLHPSRGFHLRPIEHVFNMRASDAPGSVKES